MSVAIGKTEYTLGGSPVTGTGFTWTSGELDSALADPITDLVFDTEGSENISALLEGIPETEFDPTEVARILSSARKPEDWRVGEAIGEAFLTEHRDCAFPWPDGRDERKSGSSLPGADLVGFESNNNLDRFVFGEIKTSGEAKYPPNAMYGRTGLKQQLEDLRDKVEIRDDLVRYLGHRAGNSTWENRYRGAARCYIRSNTDVRLFGFLVRDVPPHQDDLRVRVSRLTASCPVDMRIQLLALYVPVGRINSLSDDVVALWEGGDA